MRIIIRIKTLAVITAMMIITNSLFSQVVVERSKDKVIISGVAYFVHQVKKGETAYSISRAYGIAVEDLTRENPPALYGVKEGQILRIPVKIVKDARPLDVVPEKKQHDEANFIYHSLKPGETVYSLSKSFGVSENEIIESNPGIDINKLSVGTEIAVPKRQFMPAQLKFDDQDKKYVYHKVLAGETLSSIARQYGVPLRQVRKENRDLRFPQVGDFVRIPGVKVAETKVPEVTKQDTVQVVEDVAPVITERSGNTPVTNLHGRMDVAVLLPFYLPENSSRREIDSSVIVKGKKTYSVNDVAEDWIYSPSIDFIEMYNGILLAADTLRSLGLNITLHTFDIDSNNVAITRLINTGQLADMDLIIGPVYTDNLVIVSSYAKDHGIPVVSPVPLKKNQPLINNPTLFMAGASPEVSQRALAKKIAEYYDHNIVFIHADTLGIDDDVKRFKSLIFSELNYKMPYEDIKFKEFKFYSRSMFNNDSINRLSHALSEQSKNLIVLASEDGPLISEIIDNVSGLSRRFDIKLFGYPVIRELDRIEQKLLFDLDILVYSPYWIDYSKANVKQFSKKFIEKFHTEPLERSYAWQGYDIAYYFMSGLAMHGKSFIEHPENHYPELLENEYEFRRKSNSDGYENQKLFMVRYTKNYEVILENGGK